MNASARSGSARPRHKTGRLGPRILLIAFVALAILILLLRMAEFAGRAPRHPRPRAAPAAFLSAGPSAARVRMP